MELKEVYSKKEQLERFIKDKLMEFREETGLIVENIDLKIVQHRERMGNNIFIEDVTVEVKL